MMSRTLPIPRYSFLFFLIYDNSKKKTELKSSTPFAISTPSTGSNGSRDGTAYAGQATSRNPVAAVTRSVLIEEASIDREQVLSR